MREPQSENTRGWASQLVAHTKIRLISVGSVSPIDVEVALADNQQGRFIKVAIHTIPVSVASAMRRERLDACNTAQDIWACRLYPIVPSDVR